MLPEQKAKAINKWEHRGGQSEKVHAENRFIW